MPTPLSTGIVKLSSQPNTSTTSLAAATKPLHTLTIPSASGPETVACAGVSPSPAAAAAGSRSVPVNRNPSSPGIGPTRGASQPQNQAAVVTPTATAAADPASDLPRRRRGV